LEEKLQRYWVSGFVSRAAMRGLTDWDDDHEYTDIEKARASARAWLDTQGPDAVAHVINVTGEADAAVVEEISQSGTETVDQDPS
jgi:hypothetical protein